MGTRDQDQLLGARGNRLEEAFFSQHNERLLQELRAQAARRAHREALAKATGIANESLLDRLIDADVKVERAAAFTLIPVVEIAWADGEVQPKEREAVLKAAAERGIEVGSVAYELVESWLKQPPDPKLLEVWKDYTAHLVASLDAEQREALRHALLDRARAVAEAAGGFLGLGRISATEKAKLAELEKAFS
jgi:uncharacterized tellurite resistance protein B-like protein